MSLFVLLLSVTVENSLIQHHKHTIDPEIITALFFWILELSSTK